MRTQCPKLPKGSQYHKIPTKTHTMYKAMVKESQEFWGQIASENGWSMNGRGCTIWINKDNEILDSIYNKEGNKESYIVQVEIDYEGFYENEVLIKTI